MTTPCLRPTAARWPFPHLQGRGAWPGALGRGLGRPSHPPPPAPQGPRSPAGEPGKDMPKADHPAQPAPRGALGPGARTGPRAADPRAAGGAHAVAANTESSVTRARWADQTPRGHVARAGAALPGTQPAHCPSGIGHPTPRRSSAEACPPDPARPAEPGLGPLAFSPLTKGTGLSLSPAPRVQLHQSAVLRPRSTGPPRPAGTARRPGTSQLAAALGCGGSCSRHTPLWGNRSAGGWGGKCSPAPWGSPEACVARRSQTHGPVLPWEVGPALPLGCSVPCSGYNSPALS